MTMDIINFNGVVFESINSIEELERSGIKILMSDIEYKYIRDEEGNERAKNQYIRDKEIKDEFTDDKFVSVVVVNIVSCSVGKNNYAVELKQMGTTFKNQDISSDINLTLVKGTEYRQITLKITMQYRNLFWIEVNTGDKMISCKTFDIVTGEVKTMPKSRSGYTSLSGSSAIKILTREEDRWLNRKDVYWSQRGLWTGV